MSDMRRAARTRWGLRLALGAAIMLSVFVLLELIRPGQPGVHAPVESEREEIASVRAQIDRLREENIGLVEEIGRFTSEGAHPESAA